MSIPVVLFVSFSMPRMAQFGQVETVGYLRLMPQSCRSKWLFTLSCVGSSPRITLTTSPPLSRNSTFRGAVRSHFQHDALVASGVHECKRRRVGGAVRPTQIRL